MRSSLLTLLLLLSSTPAFAAIFTTDTSIGVNNTNFDGQDIIVTNATLTVDGYHSFGDVLLLNGAVLTHSFSTNALLDNTPGPPVPAGLFLTVTNNVEVTSGASINANSRGYGAGFGPGAGA